MSKGRCDNCVQDRSRCVDCIENPNYPKQSLFRSYIPTCPRGYYGCISDPAYMLLRHPDTYRRIYGDITPKEASLKSCAKRAMEDPDEEYYCYDDEDK